MAERSKAPDLSSGSRKRAWNKGIRKEYLLEAIQKVPFHLLVFLGTGVRMVERSKAPDLSSGSREREQRYKKRVVVGSNLKVSFHLTRVSLFRSQDVRAVQGVRFKLWFSRKRAWNKGIRKEYLLEAIIKNPFISLVFLGSGVRMAERSKARDLSSGSRKRAPSGGSPSLGEVFTIGMMTQRTAPWENWHLERGFELLKTFGLVRWGLGGSVLLEGTGEKLSFASQPAR
ncbi:hypothetical protein TNCV_960631 [Trichonephila clavipes]|nr:hypothetical protein TNCV_960631 [Trichonephila clavipes]